MAIQIVETKFFPAYRQAFKESLSQSQVDGLKDLLNRLERDHLLSEEVRWMAYFLATVKHECANRWHPIEEFASGQAYEGRADLGNIHPGDGVKFKGRGYVQITGRANYRKFTKRLNVDLLAQPKLALRPDVSYAIASEGMRFGLFTGKDLDDYINEDHTNYRQARRIINGLDRADMLAGYAVKFERILRTSIA